jgi:hypothetical protein
VTQAQFHAFMCAPGTPKLLDDMLEDNARIDRELARLAGGCGVGDANPRQHNNVLADSRAAAGPIPDATGEP